MQRLEVVTSSKEPLQPLLPGMDFDQLIVTQIVRYVLGFISVCGNIFILCLFGRFKRLRRQPYNVLVALLAVADLLLGLGVIIRASYGMYTATHHITIFTKRACQLANVVSGLGITCNQAIIVGIAADRLTAVWHPASYSKDMSMIIPFGSFIIATVYTLVIAYLSFAGANPDDLITVCSMAPASTPTFATIWAIASSIQALLLNLIYIASLILVKQRLSMLGSTSSSKTQFKIFIYVTLILLTQFIFWELPVGFLVVSMIFQLPPGVKTYVTLTVGLGSALNAAIGTLICLFKNQELKDCTKAFFGRRSAVASTGHSLKMTNTVGTSRNTGFVTVT